MQKVELYKLIFNKLKLELVPRGYKADRGFFKQELGEITRFVSLYKLPNTGPDRLEVICEACIYSGALSVRLGQTVDVHWASSQIRVRLDTFRPKPIIGKYRPPFSCKTPEEAERIADDITELLRTRALPIIERIHTTDEMIPIMRESVHTGKSEARNNYDADVWQGLIDPNRQPFVPGPPPF